MTWKVPNKEQSEQRVWRIGTGRRWPTSTDLLSWYIFEFVNEGGEVTPENIRTLLMRFDEFPNVVRHQGFFDHYETFREQFLGIDGK